MSSTFPIRFLGALVEDWSLKSFVVFVVCVVLSQFIGALWYSPVFFGDLFIKLAYPKIKKADLNKKFAGPASKITYMIGMITGAVTVFLIRGCVILLDAKTIGDGASIGLFLASIDGIFGIVHPLFEARPVQLYFLHLGYHAFAFSVLGAIISVTRI